VEAGADLLSLVGASADPKDDRGPLGWTAEDRYEERTMDGRGPLRGTIEDRCDRRSRTLRWTDEEPYDGRTRTLRWTNEDHCDGRTRTPTKDELRWTDEDLYDGRTRTSTMDGRGPLRWTDEDHCDGRSRTTEDTGEGPEGMGWEEERLNASGIILECGYSQVNTVIRKSVTFLFIRLLVNEILTNSLLQAPYN
jgi:hypothetical protein